VNKLPRSGRRPNLGDLERNVRRVIGALLQQGYHEITYETLAQFLARDKDFSESLNEDLRSINATRLKDRLKYRGLPITRLLDEEKTRLGLNG
jgi:hypothetical protein